MGKSEAVNMRTSAAVHPSCARIHAIPVLLALVALALSACGGSATAHPTPTPNPTPGTDPDSRADTMLAKMNQADKPQLVQGGVTTNNTYGYTVPLGAAGWVPANSALGIPALYLADGSVGVGNAVGPSTAP